MKQINKLKMIAAMAMSVTVTLFTASCSNDEFFGFDDEIPYGLYSGSSYQPNYSSDSYLNIDKEKKAYSDLEYKIIASALNRVVASNIDGIIQIKKFDYNSLNISKQLYDICVNMINHTNKIVYDRIKQKSNKRVKTLSRESGSVWGDCVPVALTHIPAGVAPNLQQAYSYCDQYDSNWRTTGVHKSSLVRLLNNEIHSVSQNDGGFLYNNYNNNVVNLDYCLLLFKRNNNSDISGHAVNAVTFVSNLPTSNNGWIFYCDYWFNGVLGSVLSNDTATINSILLWN